MIVMGEQSMRHRIMVILAFLAVAGTAFASGVSEEDRAAILGLDSLSVRAEFLDVEIQADDTPGISMRADLPADSLFGSRGYRVLHERSGSRLNVWVEKDTPFFSRGRGKLIFYVPRDTRIRLETVSGNITLDAVEGRIAARTVSGAINGWDVDLTGDSSFSTISGNVELRLDTAIDDLHFDLSTLSGRIVVGNIRAERGLRMGFGGTSIRGHSISGSLIFRER
jgi:hypothetical protein